MHQVMKLAQQAGGPEGPLESVSSKGIPLNRTASWTTPLCHSALDVPANPGTMARHRADDLDDFAGRPQSPHSRSSDITGNLARPRSDVGVGQAALIA